MTFGIFGASFKTDYYIWKKKNTSVQKNFLNIKLLRKIQ